MNNVLIKVAEAMGETVAHHIDTSKNNGEILLVHNYSKENTSEVSDWNRYTLFTLKNPATLLEVIEYFKFTISYRNIEKSWTASSWKGLTGIVSGSGKTLKEAIENALIEMFEGNEL